MLILKLSFSTYLNDLKSDSRHVPAAAFFDLDRTLIAGYSVAALGWEGFKCATVPRWRIALQVRVFLDYFMGLAHYLDLMRVTLNDLAGVPESEFLQLGEQAFLNGLAGGIYDEGRALVEAHRTKGDTVVLITSATRAQATPFVRDLGIDHLCCTELETAGGRITGAFSPCYGESKREAAEFFCARKGLLLDDSWFYTDGIEDLPLLEAVGRPVVVNPKSRLATLTGERGWPHLEFAPPGDRAPDPGRWRGQLAQWRGAAQRLYVEAAERGRAVMEKRRSR